MENDSNSSIFTAGFIINLIFVIIAWAIIFFLSNKISQSGGIAQFDPYSILGIQIGASEREIKKSYHTLSLRYHPDRNRGNKDAEKMFMMIAKAYEALTDPVSRENYEKYGNPDGKQALEISIGLPSFLLEKNFQTILLVIYLIVMVIIIPTAVCVWYRKNQKYSPKKVMKQTYGYFFQSIEQKMNIKNLPELYIGAPEFLPRLFRTQTHQEVEEIKPIFGNALKRFKVKYTNAAPVVKGVSLLYAQFSRTEILESTLHSDLQFMLQNSPQLIEALVEMCFYKGYMELGLNVIQFSQYLRQAMWDGDSPFKQIPYLDTKQLKIKGLDSGSSEFKQFCQRVANFDGQSEISKLRLTEAQKQEVLAVCKVIPQVEVIISFPEDDLTEKDLKEHLNDETEENRSKKSNKKQQKPNQNKKSTDEKQIYVYQGDIVTMNIKIIHHEINEQEKIGFAHTPYFPLWVKEKLWVVVGTSKHKILYVTQITEDTKVVEKPIPIRIPPDCPSILPLEIVVKSDTYVGVDQNFSSKIHVLPASSRPNYNIHEEDKNLDKQTLFGLPTMSDSDSDSESDDENDDNAKKADLNSSDDENNKEDEKDDKEDTEDEEKELPPQQTEREEPQVETKEQQAEIPDKSIKKKSKKGGKR